jgi:hypothetical protein
MSILGKTVITITVVLLYMFLGFEISVISILGVILLYVVDIDSKHS